MAKKEVKRKTREVKPLLNKETNGKWNKKELLSEFALHLKAQDTIIALCKHGSFHKMCGFVCYMGEYKDHLIGIMVESYCCIFIYDKEHSTSIGIKDITEKTFDDYRKEIIERYGNEVR